MSKQNTQRPEATDRRQFIKGLAGGGLAAMFGATGMNPQQQSDSPASQTSSTQTSNAINVRDVGAMGDGTTDDTAAIQDAISSVGEDGGGTIYIPTGIYRVSDAIEILNNTHIIGDGIGMTILKLVDEHNGEMIGMLRTPWGESNHHIHVADLSLDGNRDNQSSGDHYGFYSGYVPDGDDSDFDISCHRVETHHFTGYGFDPHEFTTRLYLIDCRSHHNGLDGFTLDGIVDGVIRGCQSYNNDRHGFNVITHTRNCLIQNCISYENMGNGITIQNQALKNLISGNTIYNNRADGIYAVEVNDQMISNNAVYGNLAYGIRLRGCQYTSVVGNRLESNSQREHLRYNEIQLDDSGDAGSTHCLIASNQVICRGDIRAQYGIRETPGKDNATQQNNAFLANVVFDAGDTRYRIESDTARRFANA